MYQAASECSLKAASLLKMDTGVAPAGGNAEGLVKVKKPFI